MVPNAFPYQGSKRNILDQIVPYITPVKRIVEPFAGSAAVSICCILMKKANYAWLNDLNEPLMRLWDMIINHPQDLADGYEALWSQQMGIEGEFYNKVRDSFNETGDPIKLLYLLARCVKGAIRYNSNGHFNQSPDNRRRGRHPITMREDILAISQIMSRKTKLTCQDYIEVLSEINPNDDLIYMDPPYQGVCRRKDSRYLSKIDYDEFVEALRELNNKNALFLVSYDGQTGQKEHGKLLPKDIGLTRITINAGRSSQATLLGHDHVTVESLYVSKMLIDRVRSHGHRDVKNVKQLQLVFDV